MEFLIAFSFLFKTHKVLVKTMIILIVYHALYKNSKFPPSGGAIS
ncbi:hypothetical protein HMPREF0322_00026 [Desulfitobacterium hafniense DP7]|uniref:Uncharacterized protein n=1 Tax=Desulfitobacterium hafniense DP7 TaxID=537010 RepID=G9XGG1_DESHA|nr:hypothetical protein HMPREF0322_00026 [Desulfitobacterium hafniense DP7]